MNTDFGLVDWGNLLLHFLLLSLLAVGGARSIVPDTHRVLVADMRWLSESQFISSMTLGQSAPGPNCMFSAVIGWNIGMNAGGYGTAFFGAMLSMLGLVLPSTLFTYFAARWMHRNR